MNSANSDLDFLFESDKKIVNKISEFNKEDDINPVNDLMDSQGPTLIPSSSLRTFTAAEAYDAPDLTPMRLRKPNDS